MTASSSSSPLSLIPLRSSSRSTCRGVSLLLGVGLALLWPVGTAHADVTDDPGCGCSNDSDEYGWGGGGGGEDIDCSACPVGNVTTCSQDPDGDTTITASEKAAFDACEEEQLALGRETRCVEFDLSYYCDGGGGGGAGGSGGSGGAGGSGGSGGASATSTATGSTGTGSAVDRRASARARSRTAHSACPQKPLQHDRGAWPAMLTFGAAASVVALRSVRRRSK